MGVLRGKQWFKVSFTVKLICLNKALSVGFFGAKNDAISGNFFTVFNSNNITHPDFTECDNFFLFKLAYSCARCVVYLLVFLPTLNFDDSFLYYTNTNNEDKWYYRCKWIVR